MLQLAATRAYSSDRLAVARRAFFNRESALTSIPFILSGMVHEYRFVRRNTIGFCWVQRELTFT